MAEPLNLRRLRHMEDQGIVLGTALGLEDLQHGVFVQTVGTETVDGFGRNGYQATGFNDFRGGWRSVGILCG